MSDDEKDLFEDGFSLYKPEEVPGLYVYLYHHLDDLSFVRKPSEVFQELGPRELERLVEAVKTRFQVAGWEGDGQLGLIWLPPFVDAGIEDTWGTYLWHVKQENNGTSWVASKLPLTFSRIKDQNEIFGPGTFISIVYHAGKALLDNINRHVVDVGRKIAALQALDGTVGADIRNDLLISTQGELVSELQTFLDGCYLEVLIQVLDKGNPSKLRLGKFKASLNFSSYLPTDVEEVESNDSEEIGKWFTLKGLVANIWKSFKFEPFASRAQMLFGATDFKIDDDIRRQLTKHVQLRNCIQHHNGVVTDDALKIAGVKKFALLTDAGQTVEHGARAQIGFSLAELKAFSESLIKLATAFDKHMSNRTKPVWMPRS